MSFVSISERYRDLGGAVNAIADNVTSRKVAEEAVSMVLDYVREAELSPEASRKAILAARDALSRVLGKDDVKPDDPVKRTPDANPAVSQRATAWDDDTEMPWGKYKDTPLGEIPDHYFAWLARQDWIEDHVELFEYIQANGFDE